MKTLPLEFETAADVCFAAEAVKQSGATGRRPVLIEELSRRLGVLRAALEPKGDAVFHAGVHRSRRALQVLVLACEDWIWSGADPSPDDPAQRVVTAAMARTGELIQLEAPGGRRIMTGATRNTVGKGRTMPPPPAGPEARSTSKTTCAEGDL